MHNQKIQKDKISVPPQQEINKYNYNRHRRLRGTGDSSNVLKKPSIKGDKRIRYVKHKREAVSKEKIINLLLKKYSWLVSKKRRLILPLKTYMTYKGKETRTSKETLT